MITQEEYYAARESYRAARVAALAAGDNYLNDREGYKDAIIAEVRAEHVLALSVACPLCRVPIKRECLDARGELMVSHHDKRAETAGVFAIIEEINRA